MSSAELPQRVVKFKQTIIAIVFEDQTIVTFKGR